MKLHHVPKLETQQKTKRVLAMVEQGTPLSIALKNIGLPHTTFKEARRWLLSQKPRANEDV